MKKSRRTLKDLRDIREQLQKILKKYPKLTLPQLMLDFGSEIGVRDTPGDRNLVKKQLECLSDMGLIELKKEGRSYTATLKDHGAERLTDRPPSLDHPELEAIRAYALQLEQFAQSLQQQIRILVSMVEKTCANVDPD